ncbi:MAG: hypothetical protein ABL984_10370 [Pyrinomonadaceae bacterium]
MRTEKARANAVFAGAVISIEKRSDFTRVAVLRVESVWKGLGRKEIEVTVFTGNGGGDCGFPFRIGEKYLIYAHFNSSKNLGANICSRTKIFAEAGPDTSVLGKPFKYQ